MAAFDVRVFLWLHHALAPFVVPLSWLSAIGGGWGAVLVLPLYMSTRLRPMARALTYTLCLDALLVFGLKHFVARVRPCACLPEVHALIFATPTDYSFPSGHSAGSFGFCVFFAVVVLRSSFWTRLSRIAAASGLVLLAAAVGLSRIALGVHFPADVVAGGLIGATLGSVGANLHLRRAAAFRGPSPANSAHISA